MNYSPGTEVTFRFRTAKDNTDRVILFGRAIRLEMQKAKTRGVFDYYEVRYIAENRRFSYAFAIIAGDDRCFYNKLGATTEEYVTDDYMFDFDPNFHTPSWAWGAVMYQIFPDRFRRGNKKSSVESGEYYYMGAPVEQVSWNAPIHSFDVRRFYGGDLVGVREKLPYLKQLGVEVLYLNPIFLAPSNHRYDSQDYDYIDPHLTGCVPEECKEEEAKAAKDKKRGGRFSKRYLECVTRPEVLEKSNAWFADFVAEVHRFGMKLILDGVFNHCGSFHKWMDAERIYEGLEGYEPGAYVSAESPYHDYFYFTPEGKWPYNDRYLGWWNNETLPKLNFESSDAVKQEIMRIAKKWVSPPYCCDGWRL
ncbi:MAG: alpha amylase N-terminal ig-like domain-containing protein, partial [Lachnospiraceae bacterium]|nr:alpha amylase N-terminal ig-like domain-containing protein [Lachnospiraceae bacterium]